MSRWPPGIRPGWPAGRCSARRGPRRAPRACLVLPSEPDLLPDEDDVDAAGQLLVDLQDFPHLAVLPVGGLRAGVFELEAVLVDPLVRGLQRGDELLRAGDEDDV